MPDNNVMLPQLTGPKRSLNEYHFQAMHSVILTTDTNNYKFNLTWKPEYWVIVVRATAGYVWLYPSADRSPNSVRLDRGSLVWPLHTDMFTVETVGFSGFFDLYAVQNLDGLEIIA